jgi:hypothetical protein
MENGDELEEVIGRPLIAQRNKVPAMSKIIEQANITKYDSMHEKIW